MKTVLLKFAVERRFTLTCIIIGANHSLKQGVRPGKKRLNGDTKREANSTEVFKKNKENVELKLLIAELSLKNRMLKKV